MSSELSALNVIQAYSLSYLGLLVELGHATSILQNC